MHDYRVLRHRDRFAGSVFSVHSDEVAMPGGGTAWRDYAQHRGAVAVVPLHGEGQVTLIRQYRHPLRRAVWELPAGLLDVESESLLAAARRELAEETDLTARRWHLLAHLHTSPGYSDEQVWIFLARDLGEVPPARRHRREAEEADLQLRQFELDEAVAMVQRGVITNAAAVAGLLATARSRDSGWAGLRSPSSAVRRRT